MTIEIDDSFKEYLENDEYATNYNKDTIKQVARYFLIKLGTVSIGYPFELAKLLRQLQSGQSSPRNQEPTECFSNFEISSSNKSNITLSDMLHDKVNASGVITDSAGYASNMPGVSKWPIVLDKSQGIGSSTLDIINRQGLLSAWQGLIPYWWHRVLMDFSRASFEEVLESSEPLQRMIDMYLSHEVACFSKLDIRPAIIPTLSEAAAGILLSPLELIHVRLASQSIFQSERTYRGMLNCASDIIKSEDHGVTALYPNFALTVITKIASPILRIFPSTALSGYWANRFANREATIYQQLAVFALSLGAVSAGSLVTFPLETIRRRLFAQGSPSNADFPSASRITLPKQKYRGFWDCLYRMVREEGVGALYQGLGFHLTNNILVMLLNAISDLSESAPDDDFDEL